MQGGPGMKKKILLALGLALALALTLCVSAALAYELNDGMNVLTAGATGEKFVIDKGKALAIKGTKENPLTFKNCTFQISGDTMSFSGSGVGFTGETKARLGVSGYTTFENCVFTAADGGTTSGNGNDACIQFFGPGVVFSGSSVSGNGWHGQFLGLYGEANVTFSDSKISTVGNVGGWSYAMYGSSVLTLDGSEMTATGMVRAAGGGNINAFYSGDAKTKYDAINVTDSTINFYDNQAGGFAINNINIRVNRSKIYVNNNLGNATNSGVWYVNDSTIEMCGNRGGHGWSHITDECENSTITILHNGYAGYYLQSSDAKMTNCTVNIRCNGEKLLSYTAGDVWLNGHTLTLTNCKNAWLGAVGRKGTVSADLPLTAYDLFENKTKGNTAPVLTNVTLQNQDEHVLFLNPDKAFDYARGDTEGESGNSNDDDLFEDVAKATVIGKDTAKIGTLTTAQLSHHKYDWANGFVTDTATPTNYGVVRYECTDVCEDYKNNTKEHVWSFDCPGMYVYAPLVGVHFDPNTDAAVSGMPGDQLSVAYGGNASVPGTAPVRVDGMVFDNWYADQACTTPFDFSLLLTDNYTVVYAGWKPAPEPSESDQPSEEPSPTPSATPTAAPTATPTVAPTAAPTATPTATPEPVAPPQTGDNSTPLAWLCALLACAACLTVLRFSRKRRA